MIKNTKQEAFTLIELLLVIAIISFIAVLIMANISNARVKAHESKMVSNLSQANNAAGICVVDDGALSGISADSAHVPIPGNSVCTGSSMVINKWPTLAPGWGYTYFLNPSPTEWTGKVANLSTSKEVTFSSNGVGRVSSFVASTGITLRINCVAHHCAKTRLVLYSGNHHDGITYMDIPIVLTNYQVTQNIYLPTNLTVYPTLYFAYEDNINFVMPSGGFTPFIMAPGIMRSLIHDMY